MKPAAPTGQPAIPPSGEREELACAIDGRGWDAGFIEREPVAAEALRKNWLAVANRLIGLGYRRPAGWRPISEASRETYAEILGVQFAGGRMMREPFISFWSPTLNKFYCDPTHFMLLPPSPEDAKS